MSTRSKRAADQNLNQKHTQILRACLQLPENKYCADCKRKDPRWASWNLGIFVCIRCSGTHRSMGTHISRVKSVDLDIWTPEQVESMVRWGNGRANSYWEAKLKTNSFPPESMIDQWIRSKYEMKRWAMKGSIPDPNTLGNGISVQLSNIPEKENKIVVDDFDAFAASTQIKSSSDQDTTTSFSNLQGAELFSLGKPVSVSSAPSSPTQQKASLPLLRSTTPNPIPGSPSHDILKSSILSLYNSPTLRPIPNGHLTAPHGTSLLPPQGYRQINVTPGQAINDLNMNPNIDFSKLMQTQNFQKTSPLPHGGQFFGAFSPPKQASFSNNRSTGQEVANPHDDAFGDLMDFSKFQ
ncbi:hypothetical protein G9A89_010083 [Geosiphon pyriformis]|nr:hypothetical protein G9A89_010083 [Geosiphon pyriformis]